jgi:chromosome segregation ATPase
MPEGARKTGRKTSPRRRTDPAKAEATELRREGRRLARELKSLQSRCAALEKRIEKEQRERRDVELRAGRLESELAQAERERDSIRTEAVTATQRSSREPHEAAEASMGAAASALAQAQAAVKQAVRACAAAARRGERQAELRKVAEHEAGLLRVALESAEARALAAAEMTANGAGAHGNGKARRHAGQNGTESQPAASDGPASLTEHWRSAAHVALRARLAQQEAGRFHLEQLRGPAEAGQL